ncbi:sulfotransferase [Synechococcus sp. RSCCF101]|uniref:sulfotransferase n=1 Tax=Synechococcus sp. RSCCF101 TaxID=2511069 RepID=UPI00177CDED1|nr:sulfotransferase [Synechococcus sp. RSCCF101]
MVENTWGPAPAAPPSSPNFLIGVGSQRAGSTLLYKILHRAAQGLFMHPVKELHYFDSLYRIRSPEALTTFSRAQLRRLNEQHGCLDVETTETLSKRDQCEIRTNQLLSAHEVEAIPYTDLYRPCVMHFPWLGEITPEYMLLDAEQLRRAQEIMGSRACFVLVARHPLKRFISAFRLRYSYLRPPGSPKPDNATLVRDLKGTLKQRDAWLQSQLRFSDYAAAIATFRQVCDSNFLVFSLDDLVRRTDTVMQQLSELTGLSIDHELATSMVQSKVNETGVEIELDDECRDLCDAVFSPLIEQSADLFDHPLAL